RQWSPLLEYGKAGAIRHVERGAAPRDLRRTPLRSAGLAHFRGGVLDRARADMVADRRDPGRGAAPVRTGFCRVAWALAGKRGVRHARGDPGHEPCRTAALVLETIRSCTNTTRTF